MTKIMYKQDNNYFLSNRLVSSYVNRGNKYIKLFELV